MISDISDSSLSLLAAHTNMKTHVSNLLPNAVRGPCVFELPPFLAGTLSHDLLVPRVDLISQCECLHFHHGSGR